MLISFFLWICKIWWQGLWSQISSSSGAGGGRRGERHLRVAGQVPRWAQGLLLLWQDLLRQLHTAAPHGDPPVEGAPVWVPHVQCRVLPQGPPHGPHTQETPHSWWCWQDRHQHRAGRVGAHSRGLGFSQGCVSDGLGCPNSVYSWAHSLHHSKLFRSYHCSCSQWYLVIILLRCSHMKCIFGICWAFSLWWFQLLL